MRWAIEVYFKKIKQHLGFMKEPGTLYASYIGPMHLAATCGAAAPRSARASSGRFDRYCQLAMPRRYFRAISTFKHDHTTSRPKVFAQVTFCQAAKAWLRFVRFSAERALYRQC